MPCEHVPRAGEIIDAGQLVELAKDGVETFFVYKVMFEATKQGVTPHVYCRQWWRGLRHEELEQRGWLPPRDLDHLSYDEEDEH